MLAGEFTAVRGLRAAAGVDRSMAQKGRAFRQDIKPPHAGKKSLQGAALGGRGGAPAFRMEAVAAGVERKALGG